MRQKHPVFPAIDSPLAKEFLLEGDRRGVLLIHGFTATPSQMLPLGEALHKEGYTVLGVLLPGHGTTIDDMEKYRWNDWLKAVRDAFNVLARRCDDIFVAGLSMGGLLTLIMAEEMPLKAAAAIAAPIRLQNKYASLSILAGAFVRYQGWPKDPDKDKAEKENKYHIGYPVTPVRKVPDLLHLSRMAERGLAAIKCPLLIVQPQKDDTVRLDSPQIICAGAVHAPYKEIVKLENSRHVCTVEPEFDKLYEAVSKVFKEAMA
jgi:carboxylesterase